MKRHRFDAISFIAGVIATGVGLAFLLPPSPTDVFRLFDDFGAWFWPVVLVCVGIAIIVPVATRDRDESTETVESDSI